MPTEAYGMKVLIYNSDESYAVRCMDILDELHVSYRQTARFTSKIGTKEVFEIHIQALDGVLALLDKIIPYLTAKREFAMAVYTLGSLRMRDRREIGLRAPWTEEQKALAREIRRTYMPYRKRANGETETVRPSAIPCQASGSVKSTEEGVETRSVSSASDNPTHECPASLRDDEIVRSTEKSVKRWKASKDIVEA
jgi:hypothetical protein